MPNIDVNSPVPKFSVMPIRSIRDSGPDEIYWRASGKVRRLGIENVERAHKHHSHDFNNPYTLSKIPIDVFLV